MKKLFDGKKSTRLGTEKNPARARVQAQERMQEVASLFDAGGWKYTIEVDPNKPEDVTDLELLQNRPKPREASPKPGRNDPCPCGSGKKYKKCCGA